MDPERNEKRSIKKKNTQTFYFRVCGFRFGVFCFCLFSYSTRNMIGFDAIALWAKQKKKKMRKQNNWASAVRFRERTHMVHSGRAHNAR